MKKNISIICGHDTTKNLQLSSNPCTQCGSKEHQMGAGKRPHQTSLRCAVCDRFVKWIGKSELGKIENQGGQK